MAADGPVSQESTHGASERLGGMAREHPAQVQALLWLRGHASGPSPAGGDGGHGTSHRAPGR